LPEHSDHPLQGEPTRLGLIEKKRAKSHAIPRSQTIFDIRYNSFFISTSRLFFSFSWSEYTDRYTPHDSKTYADSTRVALSRLYSTELDRTNAINKDINYRSITNSSQRQLTTRDAKEIDYIRSFQRNRNIPRTYYYLGKVPDSIDDNMREKFPFLPTPLNSLQQIKSSTTEQLQNQQEQTVYS